jgi:hypothetical protein
MEALGQKPVESPRDLGAVLAPPVLLAWRAAAPG